MSERKPVGIESMMQTARLLPQAAHTPILKILVATCALEGGLVMALPGQAVDAVAPMLADPVRGIFAVDSVELGVTILIVLGILLADLVRTGLWAPLRRVVLDDVRLDTAAVFREALGRAVPVFIVQQVIGILVFLVSAICFLLGVSVLTIPHALVTFTLAPAVYLVAAHDHSILPAIRRAITITRENLLAVFGVQGVLLILAVWIGQYFQQGAAGSAWATPLMVTWGVIALLLFYRFLNFAALSTLFLSLEREGYIAAD
jgi:hypothetical protein